MNLDSVYKILSYVPGLIEENIDTAALLSAAAEPEAQLSPAGIIRSIISHKDEVFRTPAIREISVDLLNAILHIHE